jgi:NAD(P)-dependent dehydrogenase (short-subunit alcohol dehydrogenase family)
MSLKRIHRGPGSERLGKQGITVNTLSPGLTATDMNAGMRENPQVIRAFSAMTALGRLGMVEDIAGGVAMLASPDSGWVTGPYVEASGGPAGHNPASTDR